MGPGDKKSDDKDTKPEVSQLSYEVAEWLATRDGYTYKDAAKDTGVSDSEAKEAMDQARQDGSN
ncbi:MAG: hypothetical protein CH104c_0289 [Candidatus Woesebacteria bacterium]|jgi:transposase|nr:MAG: hypothetical protein CH104c_0289 [Candidatus Woesebacteria bacterium]